MDASGLRFFNNLPAFCAFLTPVCYWIKLLRARTTPVPGLVTGTQFTTGLHTYHTADLTLLADYHTGYSGATLVYHWLPRRGTVILRPHTTIDWCHITIGRCSGEVRHDSDSTTPHGAIIDSV